VTTVRFILVCFWSLTRAGTQLKSAGPEAILVFRLHAGVTYLAVCLKSVKVCPFYV